MFERIKAWFKSLFEVEQAPKKLVEVAQQTQNTVVAVESLAQDVAAQKKPAQKRNAAIKNAPRKPGRPAKSANHKPKKG